MNNVKKTQFDWIGEIPISWDLRKIKYVFMQRKEMNNPIKSKNLISLTMDKGVIPYSEKKGGGNKPKEDLSKYKLVYPGDIVLNSMNVIAGAVGLSKYFGILSPNFANFLTIVKKLTRPRNKKTNKKHEKAKFLFIKGKNIYHEQCNC